MTDDLVWIPPQTAVVGADNHYPEEGPAREVSVDGFWMQKLQVTNAQFAEFVSATGYVTVAERPLDPAAYPGAPPENLQPGSMVFTGTTGPVRARPAPRRAATVARSAGRDARGGTVRGGTWKPDSRLRGPRAAKGLRGSAGPARPAGSTPSPRAGSVSSSVPGTGSDTRAG